jgi:predicted  nucleic acid-binding Zn-ribbon protein
MQKILFAAAIAIATLFTASDAAAQKAPKASKATKKLVKEATKAICNCEAMKELAKITKEIEGMSDEQKAEKLSGMMELAGKIQPCVEPIEAKVEALDETQKAIFQKDFEASIRKTCPDLVPNQ